MKNARTLGLFSTRRCGSEGDGEKSLATELKSGAAFDGTDQMALRGGIEGDMRQSMDALRRLEACGTGPSKAELASAQVVEDWSLLDMGHDRFRLTGRTNKEPENYSEDILTSPIVEICLRDRWVRTMNSLYKLAAPKDTQGG